MRFYLILPRPVLGVALMALLLAAGPSPLSAQDERPVTHRLEAVRVYRDRAELTHLGSVDIAAGQWQLVLSGVSPNLDAASLQASGTATVGTGLTILSVQPRTRYLPPPKRTDRIERLRDSVKLTQRRITAQGDKLFVLASEEKLLLENIRVAGDAGLNVLTLDQLAQRYRARLGEIRVSQRSEEQRRDELNEELARLQGELTSLEGQPTKVTQEVVITVEARGAGRATLRVEYLALGAGWSPEYDLRLEKVGEPLRLDARARVSNYTGVDWNRVPLTLTTALANVSAQAPELQPQYLREYVVMQRALRSMNSGVRSKKAEAPMAASAESFGDEASDVEEEIETSADLSTAVQGALALDYAIAAQYEIASDGQPRLVALAQHQLPAVVGHFAVPKLDTDAFLLAQVTGFDGLGLIPGPASVYLEGAYVARTTLNPELTTDTLRIGLGRDARVQLKRTAIKEFTSRKVLGGAVRLTRGFTVEVRNARADAVTLTLEDQVPVSQDQRIRVKLLERDGAEYDPATGKLTWRLNLKAGERRSVRLSYEVEHPRDLNVQGL